MFTTFSQQIIGVVIGSNLNKLPRQLFCTNNSNSNNLPFKIYCENFIKILCTVTFSLKSYILKNITT